MRYRPEHKADTRKKIVEDASQRFRAEGLGGAGVASVMRDTGLTHGGFYKHFRNKDDLLVESVGEAFREVGAQFVQAAEQAAPREAWKAIVKRYLSLEHCDHPETGCPLAALGPELARSMPEMKKRIGTAMVNYKGLMLPFMPGRTTVDREKAFFVIFSTMVGATELARMMPDAAARQRVLANARDFLLGSF
jgi:TetR/AcrR family transcriptional regulator, transcriptional repressor for nem operon